MGDNLFQNAADEGIQLGSANVKAFQTGSDMAGDIMEKVADSNLKQGENDRANQKLPYDIENIKADMQTRMAEAQLKQQQFEQARLANLGSAFQQSQQLLTKLAGTDPAFVKTPSVQNMIQRVAALKGQMGIKTTPEDIEAMLKDPNLRANILDVSSHYLSADPQEVGMAINHAKEMGMNVQDFFDKDGIDALRTVQQKREKNETDITTEQMKALSQAGVQEQKGVSSENVARIQAAASAGRQANEMVNKTLPGQAKAISSQVLEIQKKYGADLVHLNNLRNFVNFDPKNNTGVMQIASADSFVKELTGTGRINEQQLKALGTSQGGIMKIWQSIKAHTGLGGDAQPDENGNVSLSQLGKFLTPAQMQTMKSASQMMQSNIQQEIVKEAYGPYVNYNDLKKRAEVYGYQLPQSVMDPGLYNLVKQYDDQNHFNDKTGTFQNTQSPSQKTSGAAKVPKKAATIVLNAQEKTAVKNLMDKMKWTSDQAQKFVLGKRKKQ